MLREFRGALTALGVVVCLVLLGVSYDFGIPGQALLQSLRFHLAAGVLGLSFLLFVSHAWWRGLLFFAAAATSIAQGGVIIYKQQQVRIEAASRGTTPLFRLLSFNLLNTNPNGAQLADYIVASGADVVMLLEAGAVHKQKDKLLAAYPYLAGCDPQAYCETLILSKTPLTDIKVASLSPVWANRLVTATATFAGTRVNLVLAHMVKPYFDEFAEMEAYGVANAIRNLDGPLLLAGDFNAAAWSENINRLVGWVDLAPGPFYPATWPVRLGMFGVPIDNVFTRSPLLVTKVQAMEDSLGSNHRGLVSELALAGN